MNQKFTLEFYLNGRSTKAEILPTMTLLDFLREELGIKSPKYGCGWGSCGACTVLVDGNPILSCLTFAISVDGKHVTTLEGLGNSQNLHLIQKAFLESFASQCGFCTPAIILVTKALLDKKPQPTEQDIIDSLDGNLCRCTGYLSIISAIKKSSELLLKQGEKNGRSW